ncbi:pyruvate:ferredoxin (flavodoxin) oxidoreductase [Olsenella sp. HMSC062G07]|uniref:pyruvate:ferredoxin (flavodoxin) oxidoreductase n=1 Tax=Olsenella sp. HMSC062G07 TaxID=1739330 RepID=UPI0008A3D171|nr:pyruvate:ferredoxin (flavodoxin) oxidoreductase [Olsenella sp. HMSC062G07]OFK23562.1 pyruvate:ferredoxin (flavodoxin) oxidoreductase [Olsenella sp. HMSC062G07]
MARKFKSMDGNEAAAWVSYAFTEVAGIYPITPSSPMADHVDQWAAHGLKNVFGTPVKVVEMQSEAGAAGTVHGSLGAGALTTTYTASQGLLLMIPNMYKMAAEGLPTVFHVSARTVATQALNIFGDHSDVMACRQTGFAMLAEGNVQEVMDLSPVAHLSAIGGGVPFINFFDGFRTSHEIQKVAAWDFDDLGEMVDMDAVQAFRDHALNPEHPHARGSHENGDIFFQHREACNATYDKLPAVVEAYMEKVNAKLGTSYHLFDYYGAEDADRVVVCMGSFCDTLEETIDYLNAHGEKVGLVKVRLYRPFSIEHFVAALPKSVKKIAVLDRTKEPGSIGEPLYQDVVNALFEAGRSDLAVIGGRYGLGSKDTRPEDAFAVYAELEKDEPKREFTIGIVDDLTNLSLPRPEHTPNTSAPGTIECKFWGLGGDGTVGANKNSIKIIGDHTDKYVQAYFQYDSKKTGGVTISHLRFGDSPIRSPYYITAADFVACHNPSYIVKGFRMARDLKPGGTFLVNCQWSDEEFANQMPAVGKRYIAQNDIKVYLIDAIDLAEKVGMGKRTNTVLQSAFFALAKVLPAEEALQYMKDAAEKSYAKKGQSVVESNWKAIDAGATAFRKFEVPADWANATDDVKPVVLEGREAVVRQVRELLGPINLMEGDSLPVSAFKNNPDGQWELGASAYEKRGTAVIVPRWDESKCIQCNQCGYVCPHATIRPIALTAEEAAAAPENMRMVDLKIPKGTGYQFAIAVSPLDCMGCTNCAYICPVDALTMVPQADEADMIPVWDYAVNKVTEKRDLFDSKTVKNSQFSKPLLEFSGSCAGCAETSYARLITQLFGDRMFISNATGCSSIWGNPGATSPFTCNAEGNGPAWNNSLFEDNAEHGYGLALGYEAIQNKLVSDTEKLIAAEGVSEDFKAAAQAWIDTRTKAGESELTAEAYAQQLEKLGTPEANKILADKSYMSKKSFWIFGGDGWAYDIGFGGLDHVLASGDDVNVFVFDTEVYSNTGGQASKSSNLGQVAQFAAAGKSVKKKALGEIAMSYGYVYVAQVAMGANPTQTLKAIAEAEAYPGPSLIIGYSPCEMHSIKKGGMKHAQAEMKRAVECGYWNLYRFNPSAPKGKKFILDSKEPKGGYRDFLMNEARYASLTRSFPERAEKLFAANEKAAMDRYEHLTKLKDLYAEL